MTFVTKEFAPVGHQYVLMFFPPPDHGKTCNHAYAFARRLFVHAKEDASEGAALSRNAFSVN